jgi:hypothetical protein
MAAESMYMVTVQFNKAWSVTAKSVLTVGNAMLSDDARNGVMKAVIQVMSSTSRLSLSDAMIPDTRQSQLYYVLLAVAL